MAIAKRKSRILDELHETVSGLHEAGLINQRRMAEFTTKHGTPWL